jgi:superfamily II DNA or RNA helicase
MPNFKEIRQQLFKAGQVAAQLADVAALDESLVASAKVNLSKAKEAAVLVKLAELPIENMKDASDASLRIETLRKFGLTSVASIYHASQSQLARISGISDEGAAQLKQIADSIYAAVAESVAYGVTIDSLTADDVKLLENVKGINSVRSVMRGNQEKLRPLVNELKRSLDSTLPLKSRFRWMVAGREKREAALDAVAMIGTVLGAPSTIALVELTKAAFNKYEQSLPEPVVEEFKENASDYFAVLEDVSGVKPQVGQRHFTQDLIDQIESQSLDTGLLKATLRKYQIFGSKFALTQNRVILGDEMGLGKTMQALGALTQRHADGATRFLVVCPASVIVNWQREIATRSDLKSIKMHGDEGKSGFAKWVADGGIGLTTFDTLKSFEISDEEIAALAVDTVVVDEAHYVKNPEAGRTIAMVRWLDRAPRAMFMTGTPLENRVDELVSLVALLDRDFARQLNRASLAAGVDAFRKHVAPIYLRRNTEDVLKELPDLIEVDEFCEWNGADYGYYEHSVASGNLMGMRKAGMKPIIEGANPDKVERLLELVEEAFDGGKKVLVFSYFLDALKVVVEALGDRAVGPITGGVTPARRQELVDIFTNSKEPKVLVGQIQAAGTGLNIQAASVVILCEPQIKPSLEVQAIARAHRMGQVNTVQVHRLIIPECIDEKMMAMLAWKQKEFDDYARESALANSGYTAKDHGEEKLAKVLVMEERRRLNIESQAPVVIEEEPEDKL